jgi:hypothetical protein
MTRPKSKGERACAPLCTQTVLTARSGGNIFEITHEGHRSTCQLARDPRAAQYQHRSFVNKQTRS